MRTQHTKLWDAAKPVFRGKFIVLITYTRKEKNIKISELYFYLKKLGKKGAN